MFIIYIIKKYFTVKYFKIWLIKFIKFDFILICLFDIIPPIIAYFYVGPEAMYKEFNIESSNLIDFIINSNIYFAKEFIKFEIENITHPVFGTVEVLFLIFIIYKIYKFFYSEYQSYLINKKL